MKNLKNIKNLFNLAWIITILAITGFAVIGCDNPAGNNGDDDSGNTDLEGSWQNTSNSTSFIVFSGSSFTKFDNATTGYKGSYKISDDQITFSGNQKTEDSGSTWSSEKSSETGKFAISEDKLTVSINDNSTEYEKKETPDSPATALTAGTWVDGKISADSNGEAWYSFSVAGGTQCYV